MSAGYGQRMNDRMKGAIARGCVAVALLVLGIAGLAVTDDGSTARDVSGVLVFGGVIGIVWCLFGVAVAIGRQD